MPSKPKTEQTLTEAEVVIASLVLKSNSHSKLYFQNMANRNAVAKVCKAANMNVVRSSSRNQLFDPRYTVEGSNIPDKGLANDYKHYFAVLYTLEIDRW